MGMSTLAAWAAFEAPGAAAYSGLALAICGPAAALAVFAACELAAVLRGVLLAAVAESDAAWQTAC